MTPGVIVWPDVVHSDNGNGAVGGMIFVDPESSEGVWLKSWVQRFVAIRYNRFEVVSQSASPTSDGSE
jgi:hypothetical protein